MTIGQKSNIKNQTSKIVTLSTVGRQAIQFIIFALHSGIINRRLSAQSAGNKTNQTS